MPRIDDIDRDLEDEEVYERISLKGRQRHSRFHHQSDEEIEREEEQEELLNQRH